MAASVVFGIFELLEQILLEMPFKGALRSVRVNKTFQETIRSSPKLQRKLGFEQAPGTAENQLEEPTINPILADMVKYFTDNAQISVRPTVEPKTYKKRDDAERAALRYEFHEDEMRREQRQRINDAAHDQGLKYYTYVNIQWCDHKCCRYECMEELVKWMRSGPQTFHGLYIVDRSCGIVVSFGSGREHWFPPDIKIEELLRRMVKRYRYQRRVKGPDTWKNNRDVSKTKSRARAYRYRAEEYERHHQERKQRRKPRRKMGINATWTSTLVQR